MVGMLMTVVMRVVGVSGGGHGEKAVRVKLLSDERCVYGVAAGAGGVVAARLFRLTKKAIPPPMAPRTSKQGATVHKSPKNVPMVSSMIFVPPMRVKLSGGWAEFAEL